ncbi:PTS glucose transporter subunit IIA [Clostridium sp. KNHs214]|uniref:PTS sugar transporter subunit IIA n=1 Tax=Clostridium sp. KNHs214 TaxID=1540257 RepID=UPI0005568F3B|nr:PTS glucose transporter subunit IIA [Clostridium sp. KNHs214]
MFNLFKKSKEIKSPISGKVVSLENVPDEVFSKKLMGDGVAIVPTGETLYTPTNALIELVAETKHAIGFKTDDGMEILIHVGLDTVNLKGEGFTSLVTAGQKVTAGTPILKIDRNFMQQKGINLITPIIITNSNEMTLSFNNIDNDVRSNEDTIILYK